MIIIISGTNRKYSNSLKVAKLVKDVYDLQHANSEIFDLSKLPQDIYLPESYGNKPKEFVTDYSDKVLKSDGLVVVTPEYNGGPSVALKYFVDMLPFPESFEFRPVCFIGVAAGASGAVRPVEQLQHIFGYRNAIIYPKRIFMPQIHKLLDENGNLLDDDIRSRINEQTEGFLKFVANLKDTS